MSSLSKSPMVYETVRSDDGAAGKKVKPHYSISTQGQQLWGTHDVYSDDLAVNQHVSLVLTYEG